MQKVFFPEVVRLVAGGAALITAGPRLSRILRSRYDAAQAAGGRSVWTTPYILPWHAWLRKLWEHALESPHAPLLLTKSQELIVWEQSIVAEGGAQLLELRATASAARSAWQLLHDWRVSLLDAEWDSTEDSRAFHAWSLRYQRALRRRNWLDHAALPDYLSAAALPLGGAIVFAGFHEFTPLQLAWMEKLAVAGVRVLVLEAAEHYDARVERRTYADAAAEIAAAGQWARTHGSGAHIGVVAPDVGTVARQLETAFSEDLGWNSLLDTPLVRTALDIAGLAFGGLRLDAAGSLIRSPFLGGAETERSARARLDAQLRAAGALEIVPEALETAARRIDCQVLAGIVSRVRRHPQTARLRPGAWVRMMTQTLDAAGWPGERTPSPAEYEALSRWREALGEFTRLELVEPAMDPAHALKRLREILSAAPAGGEPSGAVEIAGIHETPGMEFDALWVAGLHDGMWPPKPVSHPFLPRAAQQRYQMPRATAEGEMRFALSITQHLRTCAPLVVFSCAELDTDGTPLRPSSLIAHLPLSRALEPAARRPDAAVLETMEDSTAPAVRNLEWQRGGTNIFKYQSACPFRAFAALRLGAEPLDSPQPGFDPRNRGTLLHAVMQGVWTKLGGHAALARASDGELLGIVRECAHQALAQMEGSGRAMPGRRMRALEAERVETLVMEWLELERTRRPFEVAALESERTVETGGLRLRIKIDRIDEVAGLGRVVIDYKTGEVTDNGWLGERPKEPQVPLYTLAEQGPLAGALFAQLRAGALGFKGIGIAAGLAPGAQQSEDWPGQLAEWRRVMDALATGFREGAANVDPREPSVCDQCRMTALCRVKDRHD